MPNVFISYRREDAAGHAGRLYDGLKNRFGQSNVFMDVDAIPAGVDFVDHIENWVTSCDVLLVLIGHQWLTVRDPSERRRLEDPRDFIRIEVEAALKTGVTVIPLLVEGAHMPRSEELPESMAMLSRRNAIELSDARWSYDVNRLSTAIRRASQRRGLLGRLGQAGALFKGVPVAVRVAGLVALLAALAVVGLSAGDGGSSDGEKASAIRNVDNERRDRPKARKHKPKQSQTRSDRPKTRSAGEQDGKPSGEPKKDSDPPAPIRTKPKYDTWRSTSAGYKTVVPSGDGWSEPEESLADDQVNTEVSGPGRLLLWIDYSENKPQSFPASSCQDANADEVAGAAFSEVKKCDGGRSQPDCKAKPCAGYLLNRSIENGPGYSVFVGGADFDKLDPIVTRVIGKFALLDSTLP